MQPWSTSTTLRRSLTNKPPLLDAKPVCGDERRIAAHLDVAIVETDPIDRAGDKARYVQRVFVGEREIVETRHEVGEHVTLTGGKVDHRDVARTGFGHPSRPRWSNFTALGAKTSSTATRVAPVSGSTANTRLAETSGK